jgi:hypothetical protein
MATICADGSTSPPALIYSSANCALQASWVDAIEARKHDVFVSSSPTGWTNNDIGLAWLEQVFNRRTKQKARLQKEWRLLISTATAVTSPIACCGLCLRLIDLIVAESGAAYYLICNYGSEVT